MKLIVGSFLFLMSLQAWSVGQDPESLGRFEISEFALSPRLMLKEPASGGFELTQSWMGFEWRRDEYIRGVLKLGSSDLTAPVVWMSPKATAAFSVTEAYMEGRSYFGDLRAGLVVIPQSFEGVTPAWVSVLPETRVRAQNWFIKRDFGLQFHWQTDRWQTSLTVHNGESDANLDGRYWVTGHWDYRVPDSWGVLATASVGHTKNQSTASSVAASKGFAFDSAENSKIRQGTLAVFKETRRQLYLAEIGKGELLQKEEKESFGWGHFDAVLNWGGDGSFLFRYEQSQSNQKLASTLVRSVGTGFSISSKDNLHSLTFFGNHLEEIPEVMSDELWLIFRIHSFSFGH